MFFIGQSWERTVDEAELDKCEGCWVFADLIQQAMCESSVLSLLLFPVRPDFLSYILCPSLNFCFFPLPLLTTSSYPSNFYRSFYHPSVFSFFTVALNLSFLPLFSHFLPSIHPHSSLLPLSFSLLCLLFAFSSVFAPFACWTMRNVTLTKN